MCFIDHFGFQNYQLNPSSAMTCLLLPSILCLNCLFHKIFYINLFKKMARQVNDLVSKDKRKQYRRRPTRFIPKLIKFLNCGQDKGVRWRKDGHGFVVLNENKFYSHLLSEYFTSWTKQKFMEELIHKFYFRREDQDDLKSYKNDMFHQKVPEMIKPCRRHLEKYEKYKRGIENRTIRQKKDPESISAENLPQSKEKPIRKYRKPIINCRQQILQESLEFDEEIAQLKHEYKRIFAETLFYKEIRKNPALRFEDLSALLVGKSDVFKRYFCEKLHEHNMRKLQKLNQKAHSLVMQRLPFNIYLKKQISLRPLSLINYQCISQEIINSQPQSKFSKDSFELDHNNHPVDLNEFFRYDWSNFEMMSFKNCQLKSSDWQMIADNAIQMLPNLKHLYLDDNEIEIVRENDLIKFEKLVKITFDDSKLNELSKQEIENFQDNNSHREIIIEIY